MRTPPRSHPKVKVAISTLTAGDIRHGTFSSWNDLVRYDVIGETGQDGCQHVLAGGSIELLSGPRVAEGRSQIVDAFLKGTSNISSSEDLAKYKFFKASILKMCL